MTGLVIGRTGQLAVALSEFLGWRCVGRDEANLAEPGAVGQMIARVRPAWVINAAAYTAVDRAESEPELAERINAEAVGEIAAAAAKIRAAFLHISTDYVFDGTKNGAWNETDPVNPLGIYGKTKLAGERLALTTNPQTVILRTAWLFAPWGNNFVRTMLRLGVEGTQLRIVGDQHGSPTSALDLARACGRVVRVLDAAPPGDNRWGIYHYAGRGTASWAEFAREIFAQAAARGLTQRGPRVETISTADYPTVAPRPANSSLGSSKFERTFGVGPRSWQEMLAETIDRMVMEAAE